VRKIVTVSKDELGSKQPSLTRTWANMSWSRSIESSNICGGCRILAASAVKLHAVLL
jgi:hypothetical protein